MHTRPMRRPFFMLLLLCLASAPLQAASYYYFDHLTTYEGLPSNTINCTFQDSYGFLWVGTRDGLCRYDSYDFRLLNDTTPDKLTNLATMAITQDEDGRIWFATSGGAGWYDPVTGDMGSLGKRSISLIFDITSDGKGSIWYTGDCLYRYDKASGTSTEYSFEGGMPSRLALDSYDALWVILTDGSLYQYDRRRDRFDRMDFPQGLTLIRPTSSGRLLAATVGGDVLLIDTSTLRGIPVFSSGGREVRHLLERRPGEYWIGTNEGLFIKHMDTGELSSLFHDDFEPNSLSADYVTSLSKDKYGNIWVGTYYKGLNYWEDSADQYRLYYQNPSSRSMKGTIVRSIESDSQGNIWFCTEDGGLNCFGADGSRGVSYEVAPDLNMQDLTIDGDKMWIHTFGRGVYLFDLKRRVVRKHYDIPGFSSGIGLLTADGRLFSGTMAGLVEYDPEQDSFLPAKTDCPAFIHTFLQDSHGRIWIGTYGSGLFCYDADWRLLNHLTPADPESGLTADRITSFFEDSSRRIWITTEGGGICYTDPDPDPATMHLHAITREDGLRANVTCAVAEDEDGILWVSTTSGIARIDGSTMKIQDFILDRQRILDSQFSYGAVLYTRGGMLYLGNTNGMVAFSTAKMRKNILEYPVYITHIEARSPGRIMSYHDNGSPSPDAERIRIKSRDASLLSLSFATPSYSILHRPTYNYSLHKGSREILSATTTENHANISGLRPGRYHFEVSVLGATGPDASQGMDFEILAPLLLSNPAKVIYLLLLLTLAGMIIYQIEAKRKADRDRHRTILETQKQKEIYDAKINFFTNITHEIRTPLTLIKMPLDKLIAEKDYTPSAEKEMLTIQANTDRLLNLTNQLLDLRKMEQDEIKPVFLKEDLGAIVRKSCRYFEQMASDQKITLTEDIPEQPFEVMCARDAVEKIVSNLLSNAVKYCHDRIDVSLQPSSDGRTAILRVDSNGTMIPARDSERIFETFYQVGDARKSQGTGLGLPFARALATMHSGRLYLDTAMHTRNSFVLELPVSQQAPIVITPQPAPAVQPEENYQELDSSRHTLLLVEDDAEMRNYLAGELSDDYNVVTAANGQDAVEKLRQERIDLVASDVMMPVMDGCQLCNYIKTNTDYSHIPVLLLTAAVGMETRMQTLEVGADGYIEKPFPIELLRANIANLFRNLEISYKQFTDSPLTHFNSVNSSKVDEEFMEKLHGIVMKHMAEQDLSIETLTSLIGTSKSTLYRKVKANTGLNINEYIRLCRLKQAAEMLSSQKYRINEVAYMVGFSSPSYFATSFQKQFNISPSAFVKSLKG